MLTRTPLRRILSYLIGSIGITLWCSRVEAHPVLNFMVTRQFSTAEGAPKEESNETFPLAVTLGKQFLIVEAKTTTTIYDFQRAREFVLDRQNKSFQE
jgi:hypothetical protein